MNNWKTTLWGFLLAVVFVISQSPNYIDWLPDPYKTIVTGLATLLAAVFMFMGFLKAKDADTTGVGINARKETDKF